MTNTYFAMYELLIEMIWYKTYTAGLIGPIVSRDRCEPRLEPATVATVTKITYTTSANIALSFKYRHIGIIERHEIK